MKLFLRAITIFKWPLFVTLGLLMVFSLFSRLAFAQGCWPTNACQAGSLPSELTIKRSGAAVPSRYKLIAYAPDSETFCKAALSELRVTAGRPWSHVHTWNDLIVRPPFFSKRSINPVDSQAAYFTSSLANTNSLVHWGNAYRYTLSGLPPLHIIVRQTHPVLASRMQLEVASDGFKGHDYVLEDKTKLQQLFVKNDEGLATLDSATLVSLALFDKPILVMYEAEYDDNERLTQVLRLLRFNAAPNSAMNSSVLPILLPICTLTIE